MASTPNASGEELLDQFLADRGHQTEVVTWEQDRNKLQCPECGALHDLAATACTVCGWDPR